MFTKAIERVCLTKSNGQIEHTDDALRLLLCYLSKCQWHICERLMDEAAIAALGKSQGMRLSWGATEEPEYFDVTEYKNSAIAAKYAYNNTSATDKDTRDLK